MKKFSEMGAFIFVFVVIICTIVTIIVSGSRADNTHYVCIEVNPRIEFLTDKEYVVKSVKPLNEEAKELIINEEFVGIKMSDACDKFLTLCAKSGYLKVNGTDNAVKLSVLSGFNQALETKLSRTINNFFVKNNILGILLESGQDLQQYRAAKKQHISSEKYDLVLATQENQPNLSIDELKKLSNKKLLDKIEESHRAYSLNFTEEELANKNTLIELYKDTYNKHIANISSEGTRKFKETLKRFRAEKSGAYKVDYQQKYNEWLFG